MHLDRDEAMRRALAADHGVLGTLHPPHGPSLVPACYAIVDDRVAIPIDSVKPKGSTALGRIRNLERDPHATLLIEQWDADDWSRLWWVTILLVRTEEETAEMVAALQGWLCARYPQYATGGIVDILTFRIDRIGGWEAAVEPRQRPTVSVGS